MTRILTYTLNESFNDENSNVHIKRLLITRILTYTLNESFNEKNPNVDIKRIF